MKKIVMVFVMLVLAGSACFAGPRGCPGGGCRPGCGPGWRPCPPPPPRCGGCYYGGNSGVRLAADIVGLVGASINCLTAVTQPTVVVQQPAVVAPTYQQRIVVPQPVYQYNNGYVPYY